VPALSLDTHVRASERATIFEREQQEAEEDRVFEEKIARKENRKVETRQKIASELQKEQEGGGSDAEQWDDMPDDDDEVDEAALYEAWKVGRKCGRLVGAADPACLQSPRMVVGWAGPD
jgi:hypothetical protein